MAQKQTHRDAASDVDLNGVWVNGEKVAWDKAFTRLSDEGMAFVRPSFPQTQACRDCGKEFPFDADIEYCPACIAEAMGEVA